MTQASPYNPQVMVESVWESLMTRDSDVIQKSIHPMSFPACLCNTPVLFFNYDALLPVFAGAQLEVKVMSPVLVSFGLVGLHCLDKVPPSLISHVPGHFLNPLANSRILQQRSIRVDTIVAVLKLCWFLVFDSLSLGLFFVLLVPDHTLVVGPASNTEPTHQCLSLLRIWV